MIKDKVANDEEFHEEGTQEMLLALNYSLVRNSQQESNGCQCVANMLDWRGN